MFPVLALLAAPVLMAQHGNTTQSNPHDSEQDRAAGAKLFATQCTGCHGKNGSGGSAAELTTGVFRYGYSDAGLFNSIASGIPGTAMPAFKLDARHTWQLVAYVRSLGEGRAAGKAKGNPARGAKVYASSGCQSCHSIGGQGGFAGPDLNAIGSTRSLGHLQRSLLAPNEEVSWDYWSLLGRTAAGERIAGLRLNEDTYSFQILDSQGKLRSVAKPDLAEHQIDRTSPMPSVEGKLKPDQFEDLVAYLASLRGAQQ
ncbi:MAG: c-type cytochrome [Acidobacteriia bacterium]|nr:c-type cytochrome [Terriglobia bacterium]